MARNKIVVKKVVHEKIDASIFDCGMSLREISRRSGLDVASLSRIRDGKSPLNEENFKRLQRALERGGIDEQNTIR